MQTFDLVMCLLLLSVIIAGIVLGGPYMLLRVRTRLTIAISVILVFGSWIVARNVL